MKNCKDDDSVLFHQEEDAIGKALRQGAADHVPNDRVGQGGTGDRDESVIHLGNELTTQAGRPFLIPLLRLLRGPPAPQAGPAANSSPRAEKLRLDLGPGLAGFRIPVVRLKSAIEFRPICFTEWHRLWNLRDAVPDGLRQLDPFRYVHLEDIGE